MYYFYLDKMRFPVTPSKLQIEVSGNNKTYNLINDGEINVLKNAKLTTIQFDALLPNQEYSFAKYKNGFKDASYFLEKIAKYVENKQAAQFIVTRQLPNGQVLFGTNMMVSVESYTTTEDATATGFDVKVSLKLKRYVPYGTKTYKVVNNSAGEVAGAKRDESNAPKGGSYTVVKGDTLWKIAKQYYGDGSKYPKIADANKIKNANLIYVGQVLTIP